MSNYPTETIIKELFANHGKDQTILLICEKIRIIRLGRVEQHLTPMQRLTLANEWRYLTHKILDIRL